MNVKNIREFEQAEYRKNNLIIDWHILGHVWKSFTQDIPNIIYLIQFHCMKFSKILKFNKKLLNLHSFYFSLKSVDFSILLLWSVFFNKFFFKLIIIFKLQIKSA